MAFHRSDVAKVLLCVILVANIERWSVKAVVKLPENVTIPAVFVFGDSLVDTGNNNNLKTLLKCNFSPYGIDFKGGLPTGRFSNGKVVSDLVAEGLGIKDEVPAYLDPTLSPQELITGVTFASGGSGYDPLTAEIGSVISLSGQLNYFKEYIEKLKAIVGEERAKFIIQNSIFFVSSGSNDIGNTYFGLRVRRLKYDAPAYTDLMLKYASEFVQELYNLGAKRIGVFSAPPIGCVPLQRTLEGAILSTECAENQNQVASLFNSKLSSKLDYLNSTLPNSRIVYVDIYNPLLDIRQNFSQFDFSEVNRGCCGTGLLEVAALCNRVTPVTCANTSEFVFWDSIHPTELIYRILISLVLPKYIAQFY